MSDIGLSIYLLIAVIAMAVSMSIIPLMIRLAPAMGMLDQPDERKIHVLPVPRVGGVGIVLGALVPIFIWLPFDAMTISFLAGAIILLFFGIWDDIKELGHYVKFIGQFAAAISVVYLGDLYVSYFPFMGLETIDESVGKPFTVFAIVGMINAINHSDGLDGLAGGESMLSLGGIAYLAYATDGVASMIIVAATAGGVFGFLRYNSHPARVFMGDGGSQFLGFTLAVLVILLSQKTNSTLSPAIPLLILGLPIADILAVFFLRVKNKLNLFRATRNHIHHRLLDLGFRHYESVMIIYSVHALFVVIAMTSPYASDYILITVYLGVCAILFALITISERKNLNAKSISGLWAFIRIIEHSKDNAYYNRRLVMGLEAGVSLVLVGAALMASEIPDDIAWAAIVLLLLFLFGLFNSMVGVMLRRLIMYVAVGFAVYLLYTYTPAWMIDQAAIVYIFYLLMIVALFTSVRIGEQFQINPMDYLVLIMLLVFGLIIGSELKDTEYTWMFIQIIILFYSCELVIQNMKNKMNSLTSATIVSLSLISLRGLI